MIITNFVEIGTYNVNKNCTDNIYIYNIFKDFDSGNNFLLLFIENKTKNN